MPKSWLITNGKPKHFHRSATGNRAHLTFCTITCYICTEITFVNFICYRWVVERNEIEIRLLWTAGDYRSVYHAEPVRFRALRPPRALACTRRSTPAAMACVRRQWTVWRDRSCLKMSEEEQQCDSFNSWELNGLNSLDLWDYTVELECLQGTEG